MLLETSNCYGKPDLVAADSAGATVYLGNGDGTFQGVTTYPAGPNATSVAVGDFNGDGIQDLAVANATVSWDNGISIFLGNGDGTFQTAVNYATGSNAYSLAVSDFNGDGWADIVVVNGGSNSFSILLGNGDGTFQPAVSYDLGTNPQYVTIGDFNKDGTAASTSSIVPSRHGREVHGDRHVSGPEYFAGSLHDEADDGVLHLHRHEDPLTVDDTDLDASIDITNESARRTVAVQNQAIVAALALAKVDRHVGGADRGHPVKPEAVAREARQAR